MAILLLLLPKAQVFQSSEIRVEAKDYILPSRGILSDVTHMSARVTLPFETQVKLTWCSSHTDITFPVFPRSLVWGEDSEAARNDVRMFLLTLACVVSADFFQWIMLTLFYISVSLHQAPEKSSFSVF